MISLNRQILIRARLVFIHIMTAGRIHRSSLSTLDSYCALDLLQNKLAPMNESRIWSHSRKRTSRRWRTLEQKHGSCMEH